MQYKFFHIPAIGGDAEPFEEDLNRFLRGHRVLTVRREFVASGEQSCWCICAEYQDAANGEMQERGAWQSKERIDYRDVLPDDAFARFSRMRAIRKSLAEAEHIPAYTIMRDDMMAELAKLPEVDEKSLKALQGFGEKKFEKYGQRFLSMLKAEVSGNETGGTSVSENQ